MPKARTPNPYFPGTVRFRDWEEGYAAALRDAAGIPSEPKRRRLPEIR